MIVHAFGDDWLPPEPDLATRFAADGFVEVPALAGIDEVTLLRSAFDEAFTPLPRNRNALINFAGVASDPGRYEMPQLENLSRHMPVLLALECTARAHAIARQLLGPGARQLFDFGLMKRPFSDVPTPLHQDIAFVEAPSFHEMITIWMPLQDVDEENGCLAYVPGSHRLGVLPHERVPGNDNGLICTAPLSPVVPCPLKAGDAVVHHFRTLHVAGGNRSSEPRRAIAWGFGVRREQATVREPFPWARQEARHGVRAALGNPHVRELFNRLKLAFKVR